MKFPLVIPRSFHLYDIEYDAFTKLKVVLGLNLVATGRFGETLAEGSTIGQVVGGTAAGQGVTALVTVLAALLALPPSMTASQQVVLAFPPLITVGNKVFAVDEPAGVVA